MKERVVKDFGEFGGELGGYFFEGMLTSGTLSTSPLSRIVF